jgi:hypothetical protein
MAKQILRFADIDDMENRLIALNDGAIEELYRFGGMMVSEVQQRASHLDSKLTGVFGWSVATLAFLLFDGKVSGLHGFGKLAVFLATAMSLASVVVAFLGLKTTMWPSPSEQDWFREDLLEHTEMLKRYHIVSMLNVHQQQGFKNARKADTLRTAEILLALTAIVIAGILLARLL